MESLASPTSRVGETCCENVWATAGFSDMKNVQEASADMKGQQIAIETKLHLKLLEANCFKNCWKHKHRFGFERRDSRD